MTSATSSETQQEILTLAQEMGLRRWNLEALSGVLGFKMLNDHRKRQDKNMTAEDAAVRRQLWGETSEAKATPGDEMGDQIVMGNMTHPTPIVVNQQPQSSGLGKVLAGAALGASMLGVPAAGVAGYLLSQAGDKTPTAVSPTPTESFDVDLGLRRLKDLIGVE